MLKDKKKKTWFFIIGIITLIILSSISLFVYLYQTEYKRAYTKGNLYDQLNVSMNTKRYVNDFVNAGYAVDSYSLKMNGRVTQIYITGEKDISISAPSQNELKIVTYLDRDKSIALFTRYNSSMKKTSSDIIRIHGNDVVVSDEEIKKYEEDGLKKANKLTKDLYHELYN